MSYTHELVKYIDLCTERNWKILKNYVYPSLYVHEILLEWFKLEMTNLLPGIKYDITNVSSDKSGIYLIQLHYNSDDRNALHCNTLLWRLLYIMKPLKYSAKWIENINIFIPHDHNFKENLSILDHPDLMIHLAKSIDMDTNWYGIKKIRLFEYKRDINSKVLETVCYKLKYNYPLYMCYAHLWHQTWIMGAKFISINRLWFDICSRVWLAKQHLSHFNIFDLLALELANGADGIYDTNSYLERAIKKLIDRQFAHLRAVNFNIQEYGVTKKRIKLEIFLYFIEKFHRKMSTVVLHEFCLDTPAGVFSIESILNEFCHNFGVAIVHEKNLNVALDNQLEMNDITNILKLNNNIRVVHITDWAYVTKTTAEFFISLLKCGIHGLEIRVDMKSVSQIDLQEYKHAKSKCREVGQHIYLYNSENDEYEIDDFLKFLCRSIDGSRLSLTIDKCTIANFDEFENLFEIFDHVTFKHNTPSRSNILKLKRCLNTSNWLYFDDCRQMGDQLLIEFYRENKIPVNICVKGSHSCTNNFYFLAIEEIMKACAISTYVFSRPPLIQGLSLPPGLFKISDNYLNIYDRLTGELLDIFNFFNGSYFVE